MIPKYSLFLNIGVLLLFLIASCKDHYNDTINWIDDLKVGSNIEVVKESQPSFVIINWEKPDTLDNHLRYFVTKIKGSNDFMNMSHSLVFLNGKFVGRSSRK